MKTFAPAADNDLALARNKRGRKDLVLEADPIVAGAIQLFHRFLFFEGEWFLDLRQGVPYFRLIFVKSPSLTVVRDVFRRILLSSAMVSSVEALEFDYDPAARTLAFRFTITAVDGRTIEGGSGTPFIVAGREISYTTEIA